MYAVSPTPVFLPHVVDLLVESNNLCKNLRKKQIDQQI